MKFVDLIRESVKPVQYSPSEAAVEGIANLEAWLTEAVSKETILLGPASDCLATLRKALLEGRSEYAFRAYGLLKLLEDREIKERGQDLPENEQCPERAYLHLLEGLQDLLLVTPPELCAIIRLL